MIKVTHTQNSLKQAKVDLVVFGLFKDQKWSDDLKALDSSLRGILSKQAKSEGFKGDEGASMLYAPLNAKGIARVLLLGLGDAKKREADDLKVYAGSAVSQALKFRAGKSILVHPNLKEGVSSDSLSHLVQGAHLGEYSFDKYLDKGKKKTKSTLQLAIHARATAKLKVASVIKNATATAKAVANARDLVNEPANEMTPIALARHAKGIAKKGKLGIRVLDEKQILKEKMTLYLAVSLGSTKNPPRFMHLTYKPKSASKRKVFLIGKGVTFDSGGLSLKPGDSMMDMKVDMSGSATVLSVMQAVAEIKPKVEVHAIVAATENMPDGHAYRPGDVIASRSGTTVEVLNTDAEGRLTLADAITWSKDKGATEIIELSTLTGACMVALGPHTAGLFANNDKLAKGILAASAEEGEDIWRMPLTPLLRKQLKSDVADLKNIGSRWGGAITAGIFLQEFATDTPFAHLDIAGPATSDGVRGHIKKGGRGFGVATLVRYLCG